MTTLYRFKKNAIHLSVSVNRSFHEKKQQQNSATNTRLLNSQTHQSNKLYFRFHYTNANTSFEPNIITIQTEQFKQIIKKTRKTATIGQQNERKKKHVEVSKSKNMHTIYLYTTTY